MADPHMQARLDTAARQAGFQNYAQWSAWQARQHEMRGPAPVIQGATPPARPVAKPPAQNWLQQLLGALG